jgi:hypothetical protein
VVWIEGAIVEESLMLTHSIVKWYVIIFHPASERMKQENWVLDELLTGVLQKQTMPVVERITDLERIHSISTTLNRGIIDLLWRESVLIKPVTIGNLFHKLHPGSRDQPITLSLNILNLLVLQRSCSECFAAYFFLTIRIKLRVFDHSQDLIVPADRNLVGIFEFARW